MNKKELTIPVNIRMTQKVKDWIIEMSKEELGAENGNYSGWITLHAKREYKKFKNKTK
jgi:hypothetical protein